MLDWTSCNPGLRRLDVEGVGTILSNSVKGRTTAKGLQHVTQAEWGEEHMPRCLQEGGNFAVATWPIFAEKTFQISPVSSNFFLCVLDIGEPVLALWPTLSLVRGWRLNTRQPKWSLTPRKAPTNKRLAEHKLQEQYHPNLCPEPHPNSEKAPQITGKIPVEDTNMMATSEP